jgi:zona occludens toxin (predicted ATPase)
MGSDRLEASYVPECAGSRKNRFTVSCLPARTKLHLYSSATQRDGTCVLIRNPKRGNMRWVGTESKNNGTSKNTLKSLELWASVHSKVFFLYLLFNALSSCTLAWLDICCHSKCFVPPKLTVNQKKHRLRIFNVD